MRTKHLLYVLLLMPFLCMAQTGIVLEAGDSILDPNEDGYVSILGTGFSADGYDVDEFEIPMFGVPIFGEGESAGDVSSGQDCSVVDLALDTAGYALYAAVDDEGNLIFRFRLAGNRNSVEGYSVLLDTDNLVGSSDPNSNSENPGFEYAVTLIQRSGVFFYDIDGANSCPPDELLSYSTTTNQQKSIAGSESCDDEDYFIDFYVPFDDITAVSGLTTASPIRFVGVTNTSATCPLGGSISDIGGVNDEEYDGCFSCAVAI